MFGRVRQKDLALVYRSLGEMLRAGVPITRALDTVARSTPRATMRCALGEMRARIEGGATLAEAMAACSKTFPPLHSQLIGVAEQSGRIDPVLRELADHTEQLIQMRRTIVSGLILPAIYIHAAPLILQFPRFFMDQVTLVGYLVSALAPLAVLWALVLGGIVAVRKALRTPGAAYALDSLVRALPLVGATWRDLDYWRVASSMEMLINAGLGVIAALRQCADFCRSPRIAAALRSAADIAEAGGTVSESLAASGEFPAEMTAIWATGEESGRLDEMLQRSAQYFADRCQHRMRTLAQWLPRLVYFAILVYMGYVIISFWTGYYGGILRMTE